MAGYIKASQLPGKNKDSRGPRAILLRPRKNKASLGADGHPLAPKEDYSSLGAERMAIRFYNTSY